MRVSALFFLAIMATSIAACTGGADSSSVSSNDPSFAGGVVALSVAEKVTVVDAQNEGGIQATSEVSSINESVSAEATYYEIPWGTPFYTDPSRVWVGERSAEAFKSVNMILCLLDNMGYEEMLNRGPYVAQIDILQCEGQGDVSGQTSNEGGSTIPNYTFWTIDSSRLDASSPHVVKAWVNIPIGDNNQSAVIHVRAKITESKSETNPIGIFAMDYAGYAQDPVTGDAIISSKLMGGHLEAAYDPADNSKVLLKFVELNDEKPEEHREQQATLNRGSNSESGNGSVRGQETRWADGTRTDPPASDSSYDYDFVYNNTHFRRYDRGATPPEDYCYYRLDYDENVWRYGLYNSTGQRIKRSSGFNFKHDSSGEYGWIGYYGLWLPEEVVVNSGDLIWKQEYVGNALEETPYRVFRAGGQLIEHKRDAIVLGDVLNVPLRYWDNATNTESEAVWNGTDFVRTAFVNSSEYWEKLPSPYSPVDTSGQYNLYFWSDSLGGDVRVTLYSPTGAPATLDNSTSAITYLRSKVTRDNVPAEFANGLLCFRDCPDSVPGIINGTRPYYPASVNGSLENQTAPPLAGQVGALPYSFDSDTMELVDDTSGNAAVLDEPSLYNSEWGAISTGALIANVQSNLDQLACDIYDPTVDGNDTTCAWRAWDMDIFYTWETGPDTWHRLSAAYDDNGTPSNPVDDIFVKFQQPLKMKYIHSGSGQYNGSMFFLEYGGFGNLQGIPGKCVDKNTGKEAECGQNTDWVPDFSIPFGSQLTYEDPDDGTTGNEAFARFLDKEQRMKKLDSTVPCQPNPSSGMTDTVHYDPDRYAPFSLISDVDNGPMPEVTAPPKVVDGELLGG